MATGGTFLTYNKVLPGAYINFISKARALGNIADRGIMAIALKNNWGIENKIVTITNEDFQKKGNNSGGSGGIDRLCGILELVVSGYNKCYR